MMEDVLLDALIDSLKILPFLIIVYIIIEVIESHNAFKHNKLLHSPVAPLIGAGVGLIPQCGFSVMATNLYAHRNISLGTLVAVYIATSDEAIPILLSNYDKIGMLAPLLVIKLIMAVVAGFTLDLIMRKPKKDELITLEPPDEDDEHGCCGHNIDKVKVYLLHPLIHSFKIFCYILLVNIAMGLAIFYLGEDKLQELMLSSKAFQPFIAGLIGVIPNCASSVLITELYILGGLNLGSAVAGLSVNAGIAFAVLFKQNKPLKQNLAIVIGLYIFSCTVGSLIMLI